MYNVAQMSSDFIFAAVSLGCVEAILVVQPCSVLCENRGGNMEGFTFSSVREEFEIFH